MDKPTQAELDLAAEVTRCYLEYLRRYEPGAWRTIGHLEGTVAAMGGNVDMLFGARA